MAFYANGVEIQGNVEQFGNVYTISYLPDDLNPIYFYARALHGDERDMPSSNYKSCGCQMGDDECGLIGQGYWGWESSWTLQHFHRNTLSQPVWYRGDSSYWATPDPWQANPSIQGGVMASGVFPEINISILNSTHLENHAHRKFNNQCYFKD